MPRKAVAVVLFLALIGAALFVYFTFPRSAAEIPKSNNQRPYPSSPGPNGVPVPQNAPASGAPPSAPHGPNLRVLAWGNEEEAGTLRAEADAFTATTGETASLQVDATEADYRRDLHEAMDSDAPPDVCLIAARDYSGLDPARELAPAATTPGAAPRSLAAFTTGGRLVATPAEFSVDVLFFNAHIFDQAGLAYPDRHWTWDSLEAISRALASLKLKAADGQAVYPLELPADFDFWNILCTQAGHPALERGTWHLGESDSRDSHLRGLDLIHELFRDLDITTPAQGVSTIPGRYFSEQRAALMIAPSEEQAFLPKFRHGITLLPADLSRASLARVNGWAVTARSSAPAEAKQLAAFLGRRAIHTGWRSTVAPAGGNPGVCYEALNQALLPRLEPKSSRLAAFLDERIHSFATEPAGQPSSLDLYAAIQAEYRANYAPKVPATAPNLNKADSPELRGL